MIEQTQPKPIGTRFLYVFAALVTAAAILATIFIPMRLNNTPATETADEPPLFQVYRVAYPNIPTPEGTVVVQTLLVLSEDTLQAQDVAALMQPVSRTANGDEVGFKALSDRVLAVTVAGSSDQQGMQRMNVQLDRLGTVLKGLR